MRKSISVCLALILFANMFSGFAQSLEQGLRHMELEQYSSSKKILRELINKSPDDPLHYYYLGEVYLKAENPDSAAYFFKEGIKMKSSFALNYVGLGKIIYPINTEEGKKNFDKALEFSKSKEVRVLASIAENYIQSEKKDLEQAIALLEKAIKAESKNPQHYMLMGDAWLEKGDGTKAISYYNQGFDLNRNWPYPYLKIGKLYAKARNYNLAVEYYNKGLAIDPSYGPLYREIGEVYYKAKQYKKAIASYEKYVELSDKNFETDLRYASFLYFNCDYSNAVSILARFVAKDEKHSIVYRLLGYSYYELGDYSKGLSSMETFWSITESKNQLASDFEYYGKLLSKNENDSLAIINLRKAIALDTGKAELYGEIGNIYFLSKRYQQAADEYELKISNTKATPQDYLLLGKAYYFDKQYLKADSAFSKLIDLVPASPTGYLWRARTNAYLDQDFSKGLARPHYEKYIELIKADSEKYKKELIEAYSSIGAYYMKRKDKVNADINFKNAKEIDPSNKDLDIYINAQY